MLKSVRWLLGLIGFIAGSLAFVGIPAYLIATDSKFLPVATMAAQGIVAVELARRLALKLLRNRSPSPVILADWIGDAALVVGWVVSVIANIGTIPGGPARLLVRGQRRVMLALTAHAVAGRWRWSAGG